MTKGEPYDKDFVIYGKKIKHRLNRKSKLFYQTDKYCSEMTSNELEVILKSHNKRKEDIMERDLSYAENPEREFRTLQKMIRDWMEFKNRLEEEDLRKGKKNYQDLGDGVVMDAEKGVVTYEYSEDETEIIVRDNEGNIIDRFETCYRKQN